MKNIQYDKVEEEPLIKLLQYIYDLAIILHAHLQTTRRSERDEGVSAVG